ncbi:MAG: hypothetical protein HWE10_05980 [Gammaproteobacteria bacterium]|nr:hypothetical protein [Gammaproteobacteria bacterium]
MNELEKLNILTNKVYQSAIDGDWRGFLQELVVQTRSHNGWLTFNDAETQTPFFSEFLSGQPEFDLNTFLNDYLPRITEDPFYIETIKLQESESFIGTDVVSAEQMRTSNLYPIFQSAGLEYLMCNIPVRDQFLNSFAVVHRNINQPNYTKLELQLMDMMSAHINRAFHLHHKLLGQQHELSLYQSVIKNNPNPLMVVNAHCEILLINDVAERILSTQSVVKESRGKLKTSSNIYQSTLEKFINSTISWLQAKTPEPAAIKLVNNDQELLLKAFPIHAENEANSFVTPCCVVEVMSNKQPDWRLFMESYAISPKELRTVQFLYEGKDLNQVAEIANLSFNTVKSQLLSVYKKTAKSSQRELFTELNRYI